MTLSSEIVNEDTDPIVSGLSAEAVISPVSTKKIISTMAVIMCAFGAIFYSYEYFLRVAPSVMKSQLTSSFGIDEAAFGHLAACFYYAYTPMQIPVGMMMDRFGPRKVLSFACLICALGTFLFAATSHFYLAQIGRFFLGFGSAFAYVGVLKISNVWLPKKYFAFMAGLCTTLGLFFGGIGGQISMSYLEESLGWRSTLFYSAIVGVLLTILMWLMMRDNNPVAEKEIATSAAATRPRLQMEGLKAMVFSKEMWICGTIGCLTYLPISAFAEVWAPDFLQKVGLTNHQAAWGASMLLLGFGCGGPLWGILSDKMKSRRIPLIMGSFFSAFFIALLIFMPSTSLLWMYSLLFLSTFFASAEILVFAVSNDISHTSVSATAASFTNMLVMVGGAVLPPAIGKILDNAFKLSDGLQTISIQDYSMALLVFPIALAVSGVLSLILKETYHQHH